ncbi:MAG: hypothetical protein NZ853_03065 [Leptospiraceae bacterium]|nr:hypothetical protein [Leptospiraceae bacterium]MDW7975155.1 hypothetical protein [Leptospiraceae bacterium]
MNLLLIGSAVLEEIEDLLFLHQKTFLLTNKKYKILIQPFGIGKLNSMFSLISLLNQEGRFFYEDIEVLFLGSCGSYERHYPEFVVANQFVNLDYAILHKKAKFFSEVSGLIQTKRGEVAKEIILLYPLFEEALINTTDSVTLTEVPLDRFWKFLPQSHASIYENLEAYGLAKVCFEQAIPFTSFLAVTNYVHEGGSRQWALNYQNMSKKLNDFIKKFFIKILETPL